MTRHIPAAAPGGSPLQRDLHISKSARDRYGVDRALLSLRGTLLLADLSAAQTLAHRMNEVRDARRFPALAVRTGDLYAAGVLHEAMHLLIQTYAGGVPGGLFGRLERVLARDLGAAELRRTLEGFVERFPAPDVADGSLGVEDYLAGTTGATPNRQVVLEEMLLLRLGNENPALERFLDLFDDRELIANSRYLELIAGMETALGGEPGFAGGTTLLEALRAPMRAHPTSLSGQIGFLRGTWSGLLGDRFSLLLDRMLTSIDVLREENRPSFGGPGPSMVPDAASLRGVGRVEYERFSSDLSWMPRVVLLAKSTYVWLDQLSKRYGREIARLDAIPDEELDRLAEAGFTGLWLIGLWERSEASRRIKHLRGQPDAVASAYALYDYRIAADLGGEDAYRNLRDRSWARGIRLASDMVPNHVGIDGRWVIEHPERFLQLRHPPYPGYTFDGPDLSSDERVGVFLEDHYFDNSDAAVVFKRLDRHTGEARYIYHGNDGTSMPWNDTAQIDYLNPEAREAVIQTILEVARRFPIIRFDAAMTLAKQHVQRLWYPAPGGGGAIPSRAQFGSMTTAEFERRMGGEFWREVVDRVAAEVPETLLLAEAFWMMEGYFVRTLGMHRVYNSAFMHMFKQERNAEYRQLIRNVLEFDPQILKRYVNFMNNPDEETAVAQFGKDDKYFGVATVMSTLPGLPMFGHGQIEGFSEKYGMEYRRAKLDEQPDAELMERHRREIFPLLHRREQFAEVEQFLIYDLHAPEGYVNQDVFAYSNRVGERASLVLFHNRYDSVRGWIRRSVAYRDREIGEMRQRDLFDGLGLAGGANRFVILHEQVSGRDLLLRSERVRHEGLYVELGAYGYRVYLDIREVVDVDGDLSRLESELSGAMVPNLDDALADLRLRPLHRALTELLDAVEAGAGAATLAELERTVRDRLNDPASDPGTPLPTDSEARTSGADASGAGESAPDSGSVQAGADPDPGADVTGSSGTTDPAAVERDVGDPGADVAEAAEGERDERTAPPEPAALSAVATAARWLERLGIAAPDAERLRLVPFFERRWQERSDDARLDATLVPVLLTTLSAPAEAATPTGILPFLSGQGSLERALAVNEYGGERWFVAERFERLAAALAELLPGPSGPEGIAGRREALRALAGRSGHRFDRLIAVSAHPAESPTESAEDAPADETAADDDPDATI